MKKGYAIKPIGNGPFKNGSGEFTVSLLVREPKDEVAAIMVKADITNLWKDKTSHYFCIPIGSNELARQYMKDLSVLDATAMSDYAKVTTLILTNILSTAIEAAKK